MFVQHALITINSYSMFLSSTIKYLFTYPFKNRYTFTIFEKKNQNQN